MHGRVQRNWLRDVHSSSFSKTIEFTLSAVLLITALALLYQYLRMFGFKDKLYINLALIFMVGFLISIFSVIIKVILCLVFGTIFTHSILFKPIAIICTFWLLLSTLPSHTCSSQAPDPNSMTHAFLLSVTTPMMNPGPVYWPSFAVES